MSAENPVTLFPDYRLDWDIVGEDDYDVEILIARSKVEQRHIVGGARMHWTASTEIRSQAERKVIRDFLAARKGSFEAFSWWRPPENLAAYACGSTTGSVSSFIIPVKGAWWTNDAPVAAQISTVRVGGASVGFTLTPNIGAYGQERINFTSAQNGAVDVTGSDLRPLKTARYDARTVRASLLPRSASTLFVFQFVIQELIP